ncbi:MAG TPA: GDP-L-fucose synthase [Steroidobacteraceae bacterium]
MNESDRIYVAGHSGLAGSAICRRLAAAGYRNLITRSHADLDLTAQPAVERFFREERPQVVFLAAARVGGIHANDTYGGDFIRDNLLIQTHVIDAAQRHGTQRFVFLGSSCVYPRLAPQPIREEYLLSGPLEPTNEWYAVAKIAGIQTCRAFARQYGFNSICLMPSNLYGPNDNFDLDNAHVLPALMRKYHEARMGLAREVVLWGSGKPRREFLHVDDLADAAVFLAQQENVGDLVNVGIGSDVTIAQLAALVRHTVGYTGAERFDATRPDGTPQKLLDVSRLTQLGWTARIGLEEGLRHTYRWFVDHYDEVRGRE